MNLLRTTGSTACRLVSGVSLLPSRPQERIRTRPSLTGLVRVEQESLGIHKPDQVGSVAIPLHFQAAALRIGHRSLIGRHVKSRALRVPPPSARP